MTEKQRDQRETTEAPVAFIRRMVEQNILIAGDVIEIAANTWAIHGAIPVDGEVIIAEFGSFAEARVVLSRLANEQAEHHPDQPPDHTVIDQSASSVATR